MKVTITFAAASGVGSNLIFPVAASKQKCDLKSKDWKTSFKLLFNSSVFTFSVESSAADLVSLSLSFLPLSIFFSKSPIVPFSDIEPILFWMSLIICKTCFLFVWENVSIAASNVDIASSLPADINWEPPDFLREILFFLPDIISVLGVLFLPFQRAAVVISPFEPHCSISEP